MIFVTASPTRFVDKRGPKFFAQFFFHRKSSCDCVIAQWFTIFLSLWYSTKEISSLWCSGKPTDFLTVLPHIEHVF